MNLDTILIVVSSLLGVVAAVFGGKFLVAKGKLGQFLALGKEGMDVISACVDALEDNSINKAEVEKIKKEALEVKGAWRVLVGKDE